MTTNDISKETYEKLRLDLLEADNNKCIAAAEAIQHGYFDLSEILYAECEPIRAKLKAVEYCYHYKCESESKLKRNLFPGKMPAPSEEQQQIVFNALREYDY